MLPNSKPTHLIFVQENIKDRGNNVEMAQKGVGRNWIFYLGWRVITDPAMGIFTTQTR